MSTEFWKRNSGFTLIEIMIVVLLIGVLLAIAVPTLFHARDVSRANACVATMRQIESGKAQYLIETKQPSTHNFSSDPQGGIGVIYPKYVKTYPVCPSGGIYSLNTGNNDVTCSFVAQDAAHVL
ncbi:MAG TPA: type II secretion system protein [Capsulimonadaceae bacterium]